MKFKTKLESESGAQQNWNQKDQNVSIFFHIFFCFYHLLSAYLISIVILAILIPLMLVVGIKLTDLMQVLLMVGCTDVSFIIFVFLIYKIIETTIHMYRSVHNQFILKNILINLLLIWIIKSPTCRVAYRSLLKSWEMQVNLYFSITVLKL